jgi:CBS domain-containing protein
MHPGLITCRAEMTLGQAAALLTQQRIHSLVVADRDGRPLGILTDFDLLAAEWLSVDAESLEVMRKMTAGEMMTTPIDTIEAGAPASQAAAHMRQGGISRLMVTESGKPVGMISVSDLVASLAMSLPMVRGTVVDVMSRAILVCRDITPLPSVARGMTDARYRSVLVVNAEGAPLGVISGMDLLAYCGEEDCADTTAADILHPALTIRPNATLREAADKMIDHHHHRLIVVDPDQPDSIPVGVISSYDIVAEMARPGSVWRMSNSG